MKGEHLKNGSAYLMNSSVSIAFLAVWVIHKKFLPHNIKVHTAWPWNDHALPLLQKLILTHILTSAWSEGKHHENSQGKYRTAVLKLNMYKSYLGVVKNPSGCSHSIEEAIPSSDILCDSVGLGWTLEMWVLRFMLCDLDAGNTRPHTEVLC